ncbi:hypothetical protein F5Y17DRAFT_170387 [Xylariaceae sp. FL0594]|nr:hypothetical protein F5Y17DRAFT_170387 [Xylariaceae sp. FL0594]
MFLTNLLGTPSRRRGAPKPSRLKSQSESLTAESLPSSSTPPAPTPQSAENLARPDYFFDESQLLPVVPPPTRVADLNNDLRVLSSLFPDIQAEVFREMLSNFSDESKLFVITDMLLKNPSAYVKGRRRALDENAMRKPLLSKTETFRTPEYRRAVRALALQEFKGLSKSAIEAVLSESNYSYLDARPTLVDLSSKSWKFALSSLFFRRKPVTSSEAETHPLVAWKPNEAGVLAPSVKATGNAELDRELFEELILPLRRREKETKERADRAMAMSLQLEEAESCEATYECNCCYTDSIFEEFTTCGADGHMVCFRCVQHSIQEAVFGQGWQRNINKDTGTLRCPAVSATECEGCISADHIRRAMEGTEKGAEILEKLDQRLAEHGLISSGLPLIRCPFCSYAEVDELYMPDNARRLRVRMSNIPNVLLLIFVALLSPASLVLAILSFVLLLLFMMRSFRLSVTEHFTNALHRLERRRRGLRFTCQNPRCGRSSCISCSKGWVDIHVCHESSLIALRTQVEQAMSMAIKRVCPRCNTSFVKNSGCNKLVCPCGYKMCYVCRKDIGAANEGYQHFCQHFRPEGDGRQCNQCNNCNLWETENTEAILRKAKADAERRWRETERRELSNAEKAYLEKGVGNAGVGISPQDGGALAYLLSFARIPSTEEVFDFIVETFLI